MRTRKKVVGQMIWSFLIGVVVYGLVSNFVMTSLINTNTLLNFKRSNLFKLMPSFIGNMVNEKVAASIYTPLALKSNPYLGWTPHPFSSALNKNDPSNHPPFSWRQCFDGSGVGKEPPAINATTKPPGCYEHPSELGAIPKVDDTWIPNVTMIRTMMLHGKDRNGNIFPPPLSKELCEEMNKMGQEVRGGIQQVPGDALHVRWDVTDGNKHAFRESNVWPTGELTSDYVTISPWNHYGYKKSNPNETETPIVVPAPKVLCMVYTMEDAHATRIRAIRETWAGGCDGFLAFSTKSDPRLPAIHVQHAGNEEYGNMWQKVRSIWKFAGKHYLDQFDWFYLGGDDLFVLPHNLRTYLASLTYKDKSDPRKKEYFVGHRLRLRGSKQQNRGGRDGFGMEGWFNTGGSGYSLSQATLRKFLTVVDSGKCSPTKKCPGEDVEITKCLTHIGIGLTDTRDAKGRERFHFWTPEMRYHWDTSQETWYSESQREWGLKNGTDCCAPDSVSFHYIKQPSLVRHLHALLHICKNGNS